MPNKTDNAAKIAKGEALHVANTAAAYGEGSGQHLAAKAEVATRAEQRDTPDYAKMAGDAVSGALASGEMNADGITLTDAAAALIKADVNAFKKDRKRYADYVAEMEVTAETVAAHVALFRDAYRAALPKAHGDEVKAYATKVRNGLNYWVGRADTVETPDTDYLAKILKDVDAAVDNNIDAAKIREAVNAHIASLLA